jgi:hypothetical protein
LSALQRGGWQRLAKRYVSLLNSIHFNQSWTS